MTDTRPAGTALAPVAPDERIETLDIVRGIALVGIVVVNWSVDLLWPVQPWAGFTGGADRAAFWVVQILLKEKSWPVFAFLFGLGVTLQLERARARGRRFGPVYVRRLAVLFAIGAAHYILTDRDIVHIYAVVGLLLLPIRRVPTRWLVPAAVACVLLVWAGGAVQAWRRAPPAAPPAAGPIADPLARQRAAERARAAHAESFYRRASAGEVLRARARLFWSSLTWWKTYAVWLGEPFPPFLLGVYVGRRGIVRDLGGHRRVLLRATAGALAIGVAGTFIYTAVELGALQRGASLSYPAQQLARLAERLGSPALGIAYAAGLALLLERARWRRALRILAPFGRMALTNYLLQSVCFVLVFFGYGLGWHGTVGAFGGTLLALVVLGPEIALSRWWLGRFHFGPVEWLWRSLAYGRRQPMRAAATGASGGGSL